MLLMMSWWFLWPTRLLVDLAEVLAVAAAGWMLTVVTTNATIAIMTNTAARGRKQVSVGLLLLAIIIVVVALLLIDSTAIAALWEFLASRLMQESPRNVVVGAMVWLQTLTPS